jgi:hypothetical protein
MLAFSDEIPQAGRVTHQGEGCSGEHGPISIILDELGRIVDCCRGGEGLFGFRRGELESRHISTLFPQLSEFELPRNGHLNALLDYLCRCGTFFRTQNRHGCVFNSELHFVELVNHGPMRTIRLIVLPFMDPGGALPA